MGALFSSYPFISWVPAFSKLGKDEFNRVILKPICPQERTSLPDILNTGGLSETNAIPFWMDAFVLPLRIANALFNQCPGEERFTERMTFTD